jgi:CubicO group peptidase (beta-lactamase class C family)
LKKRFHISPSLCLIGLIVGLVSASGCGAGRKPAPAVDLDALILQSMDRTIVPGLSLAVLDSGRVEPSRVYGVKNRTAPRSALTASAREATILQPAGG